MKKWIGLIAVLAVGVLGAYDGMGWMAERTLNQNIQAVPDSPFFKLSLDKYRRGWFSSNALLRFNMHIPPQPALAADGSYTSGQPIDLGMAFPLLIQHGPVVFTDSGLRFGTAQVTTRPASHYGAFINYTHKTVMKYTLPSTILRSKVPSSQQDYVVDWRGLCVWLGLAPHLNGFDSQLETGGLRITADQFTLDIGHIVGDLALNRERDWLWLGETRLHLSSIKAHSPTQAVFELHDFNLRVNSFAEDDTLQFDWQLSLQKLFADNQHYGPASLRLTIRNIDAAAMAKINQQTWSSTTQSTGNPSLAMMAMMAEVPYLLAKGPVIELSEMDVTMPEGRIVGHFKLMLPTVSPENNAEFTRKIYGEGEFRAPAKVVKALLNASIKRHASSTVPTAPRDQVMALDNQTPATSDASIEQQADKMLQDYISKGLLKQDGEDYVLTFKVENQQLIVNGQVFNP